MIVNDYERLKIGKLSNTPDLVDFNTFDYKNLDDNGKKIFV